MRKLLWIVVLSLIPACSADPMPLARDDAREGDAGFPSDSGWFQDDSASPDGDAGPVSPDGDGGPVGVDSGYTPGDDAGAPGEVDAGPAPLACPNARIDPGEACDPGVAGPGGVTVDPVAGRVCPDCTAHLCEEYGGTGGIVLDAPTNRCVFKTPVRDRWSTECRLGGRSYGLLRWSTAEERDRLIEELRGTIAAPATTTSGAISLRRYGSTWYWIDTDAAMMAATDLPPWRSPPTSGLDCASLIIGADDAELVAVSCTMADVYSFCLIPPPGAP